MKVAVIIYDGFDLRNFAEIYAFLHKNFEPEICAFKENVKDCFGVRIKAEIFSQSLIDYDFIVVCDGKSENLAVDDIFLSWLRSANSAGKKICFGRAKILCENAKFSDFTHFENFDLSLLQKI